MKNENHKTQKVKEQFIDPIQAQGEVRDTVYSTTTYFGNIEICIFLDSTFLFDIASKIDTSILVHNHSYHELVTIIKGSNTFHSADQVIKLNENETIFCAAGNLHVREANDNSQRLSIGFNIKQTPKSSAREDMYKIVENLLKKFSFKKINRSAKIAANLKKVKSLLNKETIFSYYCIRNVLEGTFLSLLTYLFELDKTSVFTISSSFMHRETNMLYMLNQRLNNFTLDTKLNEIAKEFSLSVRHLSRYIQQLYGKSFTERKKEMRIESAKRLLSQTSKSVTAIALEVGYTDKTYFYQAFKSLTGMLPTEYRKNNQ